MTEQQHRLVILGPDRGRVIEEAVKELRNRGWNVMHDAERSRPSTRSSDEHHSNRR